MTEESVFTLKEFRHWLRHAVPGDRVEYFLGRLDEARHFRAAGGMHRQDLYCADEALRAARNGLVTLVQRRIRGNLFSYLAVKTEVPSEASEQGKKMIRSRYPQIQTIDAPSGHAASGMTGGC